MIYYLEDEKSIRDLMVYALRQSGFEAQGFAEAKSFWEQLIEVRPELVLLDIMLPGEDGVSVLRRLKSDPGTADIPVMMVTAKDTEFDKVLGLDLGADDYIAKPFGVLELIARVKALLRRTQTKKPGKTLCFRNILVDDERHIVKVDGEEVTLTFKEYELLRFLMENPGVAFDRERLLSAVWGQDYFGGTRTVDVHIQTLRQKLKRGGECIETIRRLGYRLGGSEK